MNIVSKHKSLPNTALLRIRALNISDQYELQVLKALECSFQLKLLEINRTIWFMRNPKLTFKMRFVALETPQAVFRILNHRRCFFRLFRIIIQQQSLVFIRDLYPCHNIYNGWSRILEGELLIRIISLGGESGGELIA